jgi:hypothetical protein
MEFLLVKQLRDAVIELDVQQAMIVMPDELGKTASFATLVIANGHHPPQSMTIAEINNRINEKISKKEFDDKEMSALITCELLADKLIQKDRAADISPSTIKKEAIGHSSASVLESEHAID